MDERNGDCFEHHEDIFPPISVTESDHDCLNEFLLDPPIPSADSNPPPIVPPVVGVGDGVGMGGIPNYPVTSGGSEVIKSTNVPVAFQSPGQSVESSGEKNGECWSPVERTDAGGSERTVSSDCVSSETVYSPDTESVEASSSGDQVSRRKSGGGTETRGRKRKSGDGSRARPSRQKNVETYQSQISPDQNGIKLKIMKKVKTRKKRSKGAGENDKYWEEPQEQSVWGNSVPEPILYKIFYMVTRTDGCIPFLVRMSRVCRLWRTVAESPKLWHHVDLASTWVRDPAKNDLNFRWLCDNRLANVKDLNLGGWSFAGIPAILDKMASSCVELQGLSLSGWQGLSSEHVRFLATSCPHLQRLDISAINPVHNSNKSSAVSTTSLACLAQLMGERLTHLIISNNKLSGVPQIISALATHCPNLQVLDMSNVRTVSQSAGALHVEKLQEGCPLLRVLRITNSQLALASTSLKEQAASQGFPLLEELSVAGVLDGLMSQPFIDDEALQRILKESHKLRLLDVRGCNRVSDSSLVRIPAWDLEHLFLSGCYVTRVNGSGLELIAQKWGHSLVEIDLAWSTATAALDAAVLALAEHGKKSQLRVLNLCGSSVSLDPVKTVLDRCPRLVSLNLSSCRALPRGMKRMYEGNGLAELRVSFSKEEEQQES